MAKLGRQKHSIALPFSFIFNFAKANPAEISILHSKHACHLADAFGGISAVEGFLYPPRVSTRTSSTIGLSVFALLRRPTDPDGLVS